MQPQFLGEVMEEWQSGLPMSLPATIEELRSIVVLNISRERERCAKIAEEYDKEFADKNYCDNFCGEDIAKRIRKGE